MSAFLRHYLEMVIVMFVGMGVVMAVVGMPENESVSLLVMADVDDGADDRLDGLPRARLAAVPGDGGGDVRCRPFAALALIGTVDFDLLMGVEHVAMLLAMLGAMLYRRDEYSHADHRLA